MPPDDEAVVFPDRRTDPLKVLVCGSRDWTDAGPIAFALRLLGAKYGRLRVIHGAARGADTIAGQLASAAGHEVVEFPADWRGKGKRAGILRNLAMLDEKPHVVIAFQANGSTGTQHTIDEARKRGVQTFVYHPVSGQSEQQQAERTTDA